MRIFSKICVFFSLFSIFAGYALAYSPFDSILGSAPDLAVTDVHQETRFVYMRVCNLGGAITDSDTTIALAMKRVGGGVVSSIESILLDTNDCHEFQVASVDDLGITTSGTYEFQAGVVLKDSRIENVKSNNKLTRSVNIVYPSKYSGIQFDSNYNYYSNNNNCNYGNRYCLNGGTYGSTTYYCIPGTTTCSTTPYNNSSYNNSYCTSGNNYCGNNTYNGSYTYYRSNICPRDDYACNRDYYNSTNTQYQYNNTYCTYSNNYCNNSNNNVTTNCNYSNNYCNNNYSNQYDLPDLVVQKVSQNSSDKRIIAQICNQGGDMRSSISLRTDFNSGGRTATVYNTVQMGRGQCTSSIVSTSPVELGITYGGNLTVSVTADAGNSVNEQNESNNTLSQYLFIETDRNQRADLVVDRISANDNNRTVVVHVCNVGDDMIDYNNWVMEISNTTNNSRIRNSGYRLSR